MSVTTDTQQRDAGEHRPVPPAAVKTSKTISVAEKIVDLCASISKVGCMGQDHNGSNVGANFFQTGKLVGVVDENSGKTFADPIFVSAVRGLPPIWSANANKGHIVPDVIEQLRILEVAMNGGRPCRISRYSLAAKVSGECCLRCKEGTVHPADHIVVVGIVFSTESIALIPVIIARRKDNVHVRLVEEKIAAGKGIGIAESAITAAISLEEVARKEAEGHLGILRTVVHVRYDGVPPAIILSSLKDAAGGATEVGTVKAARTVGLVGIDATIARIAGVLTGDATSRYQTATFLAARTLVARTCLFIICVDALK